MKLVAVPLVMLCLLAAIAGVIKWDKDLTLRESSDKKTANRLFDCSAHEFNLIHYHRQMQGSTFDVHLSRTGGIWRIVKPFQDIADQDVAGQLINTVCQYRFERPVGDLTQHDREYGLDRPALSIIIGWGDGQEELLLGNKAPVGYGVYATARGRPSVYLGSQFILMALSKNINDFRGKDVFDIDLTTLNYLQISGGDFTRQKNDGSFVVHEPSGISNLLEGLKKIRAIGFVDQPSISMLENLKKPNLLRVTWRQGDGIEHSCLFSPVESTAYVRVLPDNHVVIVDFNLVKEKLERIIKSASNIR